MNEKTLAEIKSGSSVMLVKQNAQPVARLRPATAADAPFVARWRDENRNSFLTVFSVDDERTASWIEAIRDSPNRLLLMIELVESSQLVGHVGLTNINLSGHEAEIDNVLRGEASVPGVMTDALRTLIAWAAHDLAVRTLFLRVFADNPAVAFYERLGFREETTVPLSFRGTQDSGAWEESADASGDRLLMSMILRTASFGEKS